MEKFLGKFKPVENLTEGMEDYFTAMKFTDEVKEIMRASMKSMVTGLEHQGEGTYREFNDYGNGHTEEIIFKLGEAGTSNTMGMEVKNTFTLSEDQKSVKGVHEVGGETTTSDRFFQDSYLVFVAEGNGATMKTFFTKIE